MRAKPNKLLSITLNKNTAKGNERHETHSYFSTQCYHFVTSHYHCAIIAFLFKVILLWQTIGLKHAAIDESHLLK